MKRPLHLLIVEDNPDDLVLMLRELRRSGFEEVVASGLVLPGGSARMEGAIELAEEIFHMPVRLGLPQVHPETSGTFVAKMLNLACIGAIAFDKGCYTGQEVIARAHYRGKVKRRLQRFAAAAPLGLAPGSAATGSGKSRSGAKPRASWPSSRTC